MKTYLLVAFIFTFLTSYSQNGIIRGQVKYFNQYETVMPQSAKIKVALESGGILSQEQFLSYSSVLDQGSYQFTNLTSGATYKIRLWEEPDSGLIKHTWTWKNWCGVNSLDALIISNMYLQNILLPIQYPWLTNGMPVPNWTELFGGFSGHNYNTANVNNDLLINNLDALLVMYRSIGWSGTSPFPGGNFNFQLAGQLLIGGTNAIYPSAPSVFFSQYGDYLPTNNANTVYYSTTVTASSSLQIFNIYFIATGDVNASYIPLGLTIFPSSNQLCPGNSLTISAIVSDPTINPTFEWRINGINVAGATNSSYTYYPQNDDIVVCHLSSHTSCQNQPVVSNQITVSIAPPISSPIEGAHIASQYEINWIWDSVNDANGYKWSTNNDYNTAIDIGNVLVNFEVGLSCNTTYTRYLWAYNSCGYSPPAVLTESTSVCYGFPCGQNIIKNHIASSVSPVNKTTTYGTVKDIPGEPTKCWITSNLGSDHQAVAINDITEQSAGWYWQFNHKQGYRHDGNSPLPSWSIIGINENSDWIGLNDPCRLELGEGWRIPTSSEWINIDGSGQWNNWYGPWDSPLKMHAAGFLHFENGSIPFRGIVGDYWSSSQTSLSNAWVLGFWAGYCKMNDNNKAHAFSIRCLNSCIKPETPIESVHIPSLNQIIWNWNAISEAAGYKWNTINDYSSAVDLGLNTSKIETGLLCNTPYTRYIWAYNDCDHSDQLIMNDTTLQPPSFLCGQQLSINHIEGELAPITKNVIYSTVSNLPGEPFKCWIASNLGADHQATSVNDATEASAGWYWQFNRIRGFMHDGTTLTPNWSITSISENSDWLIQNDPCSIELGCPWRIPTYTEWVNVDNTGGWTNWNGPWNSLLKLHAAGYLYFGNGSIPYRGVVGDYWSSTQTMDTNGWVLGFWAGYSKMNDNNKAHGFSIRCLRVL